MASKVNLPSVGVTQSHNGSGLHNEVFHFIPGRVNKQQGMAQYDSPDEAFSCHKQLRFEDGTSSPGLTHNTTSGPKASTPHCSTTNLNHTFNISQISPFTSGTH